MNMSDSVQLEGTMTLTSVDGRYLLVEFSDYQGNVIYFHTDSRVVWMQNGKSLESFLGTEITDEQIKSILRNDE